MLQNENQPCRCSKKDKSCNSEHEGNEEMIGYRGAQAGQAAAQQLWEGAMEKGVAKETEVFNSTYATMSL